MGVEQTIFAGRDDGVFGNCLQASLASLLDLPLDAVPHFSQFAWWNAAMELWLRGRDLSATDIEGTEIPLMRCLAYGQSPRGVSHIVVTDHGQIEWDPHPSRAGLVSIKGSIFIGAWDTNRDRCCLCRRRHEDAEVT